MTEAAAPLPPTSGPVTEPAPVDWVPWIWVALTLVLSAFTFAPILIFSPDPELFALAEIWDFDENYSYGYLIPPLALYFVYEKLPEFRGLVAQGSAWGLAVMALALAMFIVGMLGGVYFLPRASFVVLLAGSILWIGGWGWMRALAFPVAFLFLMIPIPRFIFIQIAFPLQLFAAQMAEEMLFLVDIPMIRNGNVIELAHTQLEVAEACSGLRSLLALITTGVTFAYFFGTSVLQRVLIVASSVPIAIAVNSLRVAGTGWLAHRYGADVATGYYHTMEGFVMFGVAFALMAMIGFATIRLVPGRRPRAPEAVG